MASHLIHLHPNSQYPHICCCLFILFCFVSITVNHKFFQNNQQKHSLLHTHHNPISLPSLHREPRPVIRPAAPESARIGPLGDWLRKAAAISLQRPSPTASVIYCRQTDTTFSRLLALLPQSTARIASSQTCHTNNTSSTGETHTTTAPKPRQELAVP